MSRPDRPASIARALALGACLAGASAAPAQAPAASSPPERAGSTLVVLVSAADSPVDESRVARAVEGREVTAVYTTDTPAARRLAERLHARLGGSLIPYDRRGGEADRFAGVLVENAVENAARRHPGGAVLVVAEPDLTRPFLRRVAGARDADAAGGGVATGSFLITVGRDDSRVVSPVRF